MRKLKIEPTGIIKIRIEELNRYIKEQTKIKDLKFISMFNSRSGYYLHSEEYKIIIIVTQNSNKIEQGFFNKCKKNAYWCFVFDTKADLGIPDVVNKVRDYLISFKEFIDDKSKELNKDIPKSELWFRDKFEKEPWFKLLGIEYNKPFKKFIYDAFSLKYNIAIEVDGSIHRLGEQKERDKEKNRMTAQYGFKIIRIKAFNDKSYDNAVAQIRNILRKRKFKRTVKAPMPTVILRKSHEFK